MEIYRHLLILVNFSIYESDVLIRIQDDHPIT